MPVIPNVIHSDEMGRPLGRPLMVAPYPADAMDALSSGLIAPPSSSMTRFYQSGPGGCACSDRAARLAAIGVAQVRRDATVLSGGAVRVKFTIVEFNPAPAMSNNGKPEPASPKWMRTGPFS